MVMTRSGKICTRVEEEAAAGVNNGDQQFLCLTLPGYTPDLHDKATPCSVPASRRWSLGYERRLCGGEKESTAATCNVKKEMHSGADEFHLGVEPSEGADYLQLVYPSPSLCEESQETDYKSLKKAVNLSNIVADRPQNSGQADSNATSLNISDMLTLEDEFSSIDSKPIDVLVTVGRYRVKPDLEPILKGILSKYGDIASRCRKSNKYRSLLVESVCGVVQKLQATEFVYLTVPEIDSMSHFLKDMESEVNVGWLLQRLGEIKKAKRLLRESPTVKQAKRKNHQAAELKEVEIVGYEEEISKLQEKIKSAKQEMELRKQEKRKFEELLSHTKVQLKRFHCGRMTDGLI